METARNVGWEEECFLKGSPCLVISFRAWVASGNTQKLGDMQQSASLAPQQLAVDISDSDSKTKQKNKKEEEEEHCVEG